MDVTFSCAFHDIEVIYLFWGVGYDGIPATSSESGSQRLSKVPNLLFPNWNIWTFTLPKTLYLGVWVFEWMCGGVGVWSCMSLHAWQHGKGKLWLLMQLSTWCLGLNNSLASSCHIEKVVGLQVSRDTGITISKIIISGIFSMVLSPGFLLRFGEIRAWFLMLRGKAL